MATSSTTKIAGFSAASFVFALALPYLSRLSTSLLPFVGDFPVPDYLSFIPIRSASYSSSVASAADYVCDPYHRYSTELVSLDPLVIYIHNLLSPADIAALLAVAEPEFAPSEVTKNGRSQSTRDRTSQSAGLPRDDAAVACVLQRARRFMGTMLRDGWDEMGPPQLVRYTAGQRFNTHHDWYEAPRWASDGSDRRWNRVASFFAVLQDNCTGGETHFPYLEPAITRQSPAREPVWVGGWHELEERQKRLAGTGRAKKSEDDDGEEDLEMRPPWRKHEDGGLAFRPISGNALFWVNLFPNGTGDERTVHAGLPLGEGLKTAMNIWPRQYYPYE